MQYEEIRPLKQSEKSTVLLMREKDGERLLVKKVLKGRHPVYLELLNCPHPCIPALYEVQITDNDTTVFEEYIDGQPLDEAALTEKQVCRIIKELCSVLDFLHGKGIIHRDIKPPNIILADDGHIRLIDFDAARIPKEDMEQDTRLLGTRGYAPPEQYGFSQTDARADIYALGVTMEQLLRANAGKPRYKRIIRKCTNLNPDKRYQSIRRVKGAFSFRKRCALYCSIAALFAAFLWIAIPNRMMQPAVRQDGAELTVLPAPGTPHWNGETGIAVWGNVPEAEVNEEICYNWRLYRKDTPEPPGPEDEWIREGTACNGWDTKLDQPVYETNLSDQLRKNGYFYFTVSAVGDGVHYADSPYVMSDAFEYTGEDAPPLPTPAEPAWKIIDDGGKQYFAFWNNLGEYTDTDSFNVRVYNQEGIQVTNNIWSKQDILNIARGGVWIDMNRIGEKGNAYRFTVQAISSRPNEYSSTPKPDPTQEESFSDWLYR